MDRPSRPLAACRVTAAAALLLTAVSAAPLAAKGCAETLPGQSLQPPAALWGDLAPARVLVDATRWTGSQLPNTSYPITTSIDVENGWLFQTFYGGLAIWDGRANPGSPTRVAVRGGFSPDSNIPGWRPPGEFTQVVQAVDAPEGVDDVIVVGALPSLGVTIWDTADKSTPRQLYQDLGKFVYQVYAARIGGRDWAFAADFQSNMAGVHVYDMTTAKGFGTTRCEESTAANDRHCGVYRGRIGAAQATKYLAGLQVGTRHFLVTSGGDATGSGLAIWDVTNPAAPALVVQDFASPFSTHGVALWTQGGRHYLAARTTRNRPTEELGRIFDVTACLTTGCSGLQALQLWQTTLKPYPESVYWLSTTFSRSGAKPFVYFGNHDVCRSGNAAGQTEYLFDVANPAAPLEVTPKQTIVHEGVTVDYWSWFYSDLQRGFAHMGPRMAKFNGPYLYRAGATVFDVHEWKGSTAGPPTARFVASPAQAYVGDPVTFTDTSTGGVTARAWTFQSGSPASSASASQVVTFGSAGQKAVTLSVTNAFGGDTETAQVAVLSAAPAVASASASPASPLVCQPVTLTASGITGKAPVAVSWQVLDGANQPVGSGATNPYSWSSLGRPAGAYRAVATVTNGTGSASATATFSLAPLPALPAAGTFAPTRDAFAAGTVQFHLAAVGATEWRWDFGDGTVTGWIADPASGANPVHTYATAGSYPVRAWVRNCAVAPEGVASAVLPVTITATGPLAITTFQAQGCQIFCDFPVGQEIPFVHQVDGNPTAYQYDWDGNGTFEQTSATPVTSHAYDAAGQYVPVLRLQRGTELSTPRAHPMAIQAYPAPAAVAAPSGLTAIALATHVALAWTDNAADESSFLVERGSAATGPFTQIATRQARAGTGATSWDDATATCGVAYWYRVRAHRAADLSSSAFSNVAGATRSCPQELDVATSFYTVAPCRIVDTRLAASAPILTTGVTRAFAVADRCGVPAGARAVALNVTVTQPSGGGHVALHPTGAAPLGSTINFAAGATRANSAILKLGPDGGLAATAAIGGGGTVHVIVDVAGYFQ